MSRPVIRRIVVSVLAAFSLVFSLLQSAAAQRAMPDAAPLSNFNPLCDSSLIHCLEVDDFAGHVYGHVQVLPRSDRRDTAAVFPLGATLELFGRFAGGLSTSYSFWKEGDFLYQQLGPLRLSLIGRLLPIFPLWTSGGNSKGGEAGDPHYAPPRGFRLGVAFEQEIRVGPFSGANSLGLLSDLASLYLVGSKMLGPFQLSASVGALYDWRGSFATGSVAAQLGVYPPFFRALRVYVEGMGRGFPAYVKKDAVLPGVEGQAPLQPQGLVGLGLSFHPHARIDLGVSVQRGFGGLAPWVVSVNLLTISVGKTYQGRSATPIGQLAADVTAEFASWAIEKLKSIDPYLKKDCVLYDDDHKPIRKLGELGPDGKHCSYQGLAVPIGPHFWHNRADTVLCYDKRLTDCFLTRSDYSAPWEPIHPLLIRDDCFAYYNGRPWMRVGKPSADKQSCENQGHIIPIGQTLKPDHNHTRYYCYDERDKAKNQTRKSWCLQAPEKPQTDGQYTGRRFASGIDKAQDRLNGIGDRVHQVIDEGAAGVPLHATTPVQEATDAGKGVLNRLKNITDDDAKDAFFGVIKGTKDWLSKPFREQVGDVAEDLGDTAVSPSTYIPGAVMFGKGGKLTLNGAEAATDAVSTGKKVKHLGKSAKHAEHAAAGAANAEKKTAQAVHAAEQGVEPHPTAQSLLKKHEEKGGHALSRHSGKSDDELVDRLKQDDKISGASTFHDEATAERVVSSTMDANQKEIEAWLKSNEKKNLTLDYKGDKVVGRGIMRGEDAVKDKTEAVIVLKKEKGGGYYVLTAYPQ